MLRGAYTWINAVDVVYTGDFSLTSRSLINLLFQVFKVKLILKNEIFNVTKKTSSTSMKLFVLKHQSYF